MDTFVPEKQVTPKKVKAKFASFTFGLGKDREYLVENLGMLIAGGMPIMVALDSIAAEMRSSRTRTIIGTIKSDIESGFSLWRALENSRLFPAHAVSLIRLGEESGRLTENLKVVATEEEKNRALQSKLRSAMMYPVFVLSLTVIIGVGIAWFILPKLAIVFSQLKIQLPLITKVLIGTGSYLGTHGQFVVPGGIFVMMVLLFFLFSFSRTKFIGQSIIWYTPGVNGLIKEIELARFGYLLGTLLQAGLPIVHALDSLASATDIPRYRKFFLHLRDSVHDGNSLQKSFASYKNLRRLVPTPIQQLIVAGEQSGTLPETLLKIGQSFEVKADTSTKNLTVILEPILLVIVWLGVVSVALAVILPIYSLIGDFNAGSPAETVPPPVTVTEEVVNVSPPEEVITEDATTLREQPVTMLRILSTEIGYLNVRDTPSRTGTIVSKVLPNETFEYTGKNEDWYNIVLPDGNSGWVLGKYIEIIE